MTNTGIKSGYATPMVWMHWLTLILIAVVYALMELKSFAPRGSDLRLNMALLHYLLGLFVFIFVGIRLVLRLAYPTPPINPPRARWENAFAKMMYWLLYAIMIALPVLGWLALSANGKPVHIFIFDLPFLLEPDRDLARRFKQFHEWIGTAGYVAIGLHASAALFHHYVRRDSTLKRMLPPRWR